MYSIFLVNFRYTYGATFHTLEDAIKVAKYIGFECVIQTFDDAAIVAVVSPLSGVSYMTFNINNLREP
jgi:hypothetical protein